MTMAPVLENPVGAGAAPRDGLGVVVSAIVSGRGYPRCEVRRRWKASIAFLPQPPPKAKINHLVRWW